MQRLLSGRDLTKWRAAREGDRASWPQRLRLAVDIACVFVFLHEHPDGPFTYDDNHPGQYFLDGDGGLTMVDLDTVQQASAVGNETRCRCFGCRGGRANCEFLNSPEGYRYCGAPGLAADPSVRCTPSTDLWFIGQLLWAMLPGSRGGPLESFGESVGKHVAAGRLPKVGDHGEPRYAELVRKCFATDPSQRPRATELADTLLQLCEKHDCGAPRTCPAPYFDPAGYMD
eukprot:TRINITY_DN14731_c0_g1_i2.p3 TRINITY_DN14731_c0_g1~~TRINITY_DN14731_c0_g1_i2.p3  ORF type:complete len:229 (+),score=45.39 TRINITY_DN14731_c0_g1_i2:1214-1900(+)